jgi:hypothetical protein
MRRIAFVLLAALAAGSAWWLKREGPRSSFGAYSEAQLDTLEAAYRSALQMPAGPGPDLDARREAALDARLSLERLQHERFRRRALLGAETVAILAMLGALLPRRGRVRGSPKEERRLADALGFPALCSRPSAGRRPPFSEFRSTQRRRWSRPPLRRGSPRATPRSSRDSTRASDRSSASSVRRSGVPGTSW